MGEANRTRLLLLLLCMVMMMRRRRRRKRRMRTRDDGKRRRCSRREKECADGEGCAPDDGDRHDEEKAEQADTLGTVSE